MGDKLLDTNQVISGITIMLSFFVGYKYALKRNQIREEDLSGEDKASPAGAAALPSKIFSCRGDYKMVLVVRNDLKMGKGKIAAQCSHGAVGAYQKAVSLNKRLVDAWEDGGCAKIALKVESEEELMEIKRFAEKRNLVTCLIRDAGRTQIEPNTKTVVAIGPAPVRAIDEVTGHLKLL